LFVTSGLKARLTRTSLPFQGLRVVVLATGQENRAARCGASGKRLDASCRQYGGARRVALSRPLAALRPSTAVPLRFSGPLLAKQTTECDADPG